jgi:hypothetical protein
VSPRHEYELAYNGFLLTLPANQLPLLAMVPGVIAVHPDLIVVRESAAEPLEIDLQPELVNGVPAVNARCGPGGRHVRDAVPRRAARHGARSGGRRLRQYA